MNGNDVRKEILKLSYKGQTSHIGSNLSCADMVAACFNVYNFNPDDENRDIFILSKGHAVCSLYAAYFLENYITNEFYSTYCDHGSQLGEHPIAGCRGIEAATGSLGHGLPIGNGIALANKIKNNNVNVIILMSDGEMNEGSNYEGLLFSPALELNNITILIDYNKWQATGRTNDVLAVAPLADKLKSFGWETFDIDGHTQTEIELTLKLETNKPKAIICNTVKGYGIPEMEDNNHWHYRKIDKKMLDEYLELLK